MKEQFAVIQTGGKQYVVKPGDVLKVEKLPGYGDKRPEKGAGVVFNEVLLVDDGESTTVGTPYISGASVMATFLEDGRNKKVVTRKYKPKTRYRKTTGHRQHYSKVRIETIK